VTEHTVTITYHLVPAEYYRDCDSTADYVPQSFADEGFIHCTDGEQNVAETANRYYKDDRRMYVVLAIDTTKLKAEIKYEDESKIYPHIYGSLNRDAIVGVLPILREADGTFLPPRALESGSA
jgi:uncharacterized protein (DUF952 family)